MASSDDRSIDDRSTEQSGSAGSGDVETPRQDPYWPEVEHPVTELMAPTQGASSPFGETEFPLPSDRLGYEHPNTQINR